MIGTLLPLVLAQAAAPVQAPAAPTPATWTTLPALPYRAAPVLTPQMTRFVRIEVDAGRCAAALRNGTIVTLRVDLLVLVGQGNRIQKITPIAIRCPSVEQYAAGLVTGLARDNIDAPPSAAGGWYRTSLSFTWAQ